MKVAITGASGFIGHHLCQTLNKSGKEIFSLARNKQKFLEKKTSGSFVSFDLAFPDKAFANLPDDLDAMVHLAAVLFGKKEEDFYLANVEGLKDILSPLIRKYGNKNFKFVLVSSIAASGPSDQSGAKNETSPDIPVSHYGKSKLQAEVLLKEIVPKSWIVTIIRPPMVIGPGDPAMAEVFKLISRGLSIYPGGKSSQMKRISFVSVFDLCRSIDSALSNTPKQKVETFYIANPHTPTLREIHQAIYKATAAPFFLELGIPSILLKLGAIFSDLLNLKSGLTRDKVKEIMASGWEFSPEKSIKLLDLKYRDGIEYITRITAKDYRENKMI